MDLATQKLVALIVISTLTAGGLLLILWFKNGG